MVCPLLFFSFESVYIARDSLSGILSDLRSPYHPDLSCKTNRFYIFAPHANQSKMIMIPYISYFDYQPRQSVKFPRTFFYLYLRSIPGFICSSTKLAHSQFTWIARYISCTIQQLPLLFFIFSVIILGVFNSI